MKGILLVNLGTPNDPSPPAVATYLEQFLMDPYVIGAPEWVRSILVKKVILPRRSVRSSEKYKSIWTERGSPLKFHTMDLKDGVQKLLPNTAVQAAFRYGSPSIQEGMKALSEQGVKDLLVLPLYPHLADSSVTTVWNQIDSLRSQFNFKIHKHDIFYSENWFLKSWADILKDELEVYSADHILFSYHGIPISHVTRVHPACQATATKTKLRDCPSECPPDPCYIGQCHLTSKLIFQHLSEGRETKGLGFSTSFQSRLGPFKWTEPNTVQWLDRLHAKGIRRPLVVCPSFVSDCLETLEEIGIEEKKHFLKIGGEDLRLSPCLNSHPSWVSGLSQNLSLKMESL